VRDELVVVAGLRVVHDGAHLGQVRGAQVVRDVMHRRLGQQAKRLGSHLKELSPVRSFDRPHALAGQQPVCRVVGSLGKQIFVFELGHRGSFDNNTGECRDLPRSALACGPFQRRTRLAVAGVTPFGGPLPNLHREPIGLLRRP